MSKQEMVAYLVNLHILMEAQTNAGEKSSWLVEEYTRAWGEFKSTLKEKTNAKD